MVDETSQLFSIHKPGLVSRTASKAKSISFTTPGSSRSTNDAQFSKEKIQLCGPIRRQWNSARNVQLRGTKRYIPERRNIQNVNLMINPEFCREQNANTTTTARPIPSPLRSIGAQRIDSEYHDILMEFDSLFSSPSSSSDPRSYYSEYTRNNSPNNTESCTINSNTPGLSSVTETTYSPDSTSYDFPAQGYRSPSLESSDSQKRSKPENNTLNNTMSSMCGEFVRTITPSHSDRSFSLNNDMISMEMYPMNNTFNTLVPPKGNGSNSSIQLNKSISQKTVTFNMSTIRKKNIRTNTSASFGSRQRRGSRNNENFGKATMSNCSQSYSIINSNSHGINKTMGFHYSNLRASVNSVRYKNTKTPDNHPSNINKEIKNTMNANNNNTQRSIKTILSNGKSNLANNEFKKIVSPKSSCLHVTLTPVMNKSYNIINPTSKVKDYHLQGATTSISNESCITVTDKSNYFQRTICSDNNESQSQNTNFKKNDSKEFMATDELDIKSDDSFKTLEDHYSVVDCSELNEQPTLVLRSSPSATHGTLVNTASRNKASHKQYCSDTETTPFVECLQALSYTECPSEILQKETNFEIIEGLPVSNSVVTWNTASEVDQESGDEIDVNDEINSEPKWPPLPCIQPQSYYIDKLYKRSNDSNLRTIKTTGCDIWKHKYASRYFGSNRCNSKFKRFPSNRYKLPRIYLYGRRRNSWSRVYHRRWVYMWRRALQRFTFWPSLSPFQNRISYKKHFSHSLTKEGAITQTNISAFQESGMASELKNLKSAATSVNKSLAPSGFSCSTSPKPMFSRPNLGPIFPFLYKSTPASLNALTFKPKLVSASCFVAPSTESKEGSDNLVWNAEHGINVTRVQRSCQNEGITPLKSGWCYAAPGKSTKRESDYIWNVQPSVEILREDRSCQVDEVRSTKPQSVEKATSYFPFIGVPASKNNSVPLPISITTTIIPKFKNASCCFTPNTSSKGGIALIRNTEQSVDIPRENRSCQHDEIQFENPHSVERSTSYNQIVETRNLTNISEIPVTKSIDRSTSLTRTVPKTEDESQDIGIQKSQVAAAVEACVSAHTSKLNRSTSSNSVWSEIKGIGCQTETREIWCLSDANGAAGNFEPKLSTVQAVDQVVTVTSPTTIQAARPAPAIPLQTGHLAKTFGSSARIERMPVASKGILSKSLREKKKRESIDAQKSKSKKLVCTEPKITSILPKQTPGKDLSITLILSNQNAVMTSVKPTVGQNQIKEPKQGILPTRRSVSTICLLEENEKAIHLCANCSSVTNVRKNTPDYMISCSKCSRVIGGSGSVETLLNRLIKKALLDCGTQSPCAIDLRDNTKTYPSNCKSTNTFIERQSKSICAVPTMTTRSCTNVHMNSNVANEYQEEDAVCRCITAEGLSCNEATGKCSCSHSPDKYTVSPVASTGSEHRVVPPSTKDMATGRNIRNASTSIPANIQHNGTDTSDLLDAFHSMYSVFQSHKCLKVSSNRYTDKLSSNSQFNNNSVKYPQASKLLANKSVETSINHFSNLLNDKPSLKSNPSICQQPANALVSKSVEVSINPISTLSNNKPSLKSCLSPHLSSRTRLTTRKKAASFDESILTTATRSSYLDANKWIKTCTSMQNGYQTVSHQSKEDTEEPLASIHMDSSQIFANKSEDCRRCVDDLYGHPTQDPNLTAYDNFLKTLEDAEDPLAVANPARYWRETSPTSAEILGGELANQARYEPPVRDKVSSDRRSSTDTSNLKVAPYYVQDMGTDANPDDTSYSLSLRKSADTATTDAQIVSNKSACVLTTQCVLPPRMHCKYLLKSGQPDTPCVFVYGDPVCAVHKCVYDVQTQATEQEILQNTIPGRNDVGVITPFFGMLPRFAGRDSDNSRMGALLSPRVYKALYETTRMLVNDDSCEMPVKETTCAYMELPVRHQRLASDTAAPHDDITVGEDASYHDRISADTSAQTSVSRIRSRHITLVDNKSSKDVVKLYKRKSPKKSILIKKSHGKELQETCYTKKSIRHKLDKKIEEPLKEEQENDQETDEIVENEGQIDVHETDLKKEVMYDDGMTNLVESCRYYSNMLTNHLSKVKENFTKHLTTYYEDTEEYLQLPHTSNTIKPNSRRSWTNHRKLNIGEPLPRLTPSASLTDICRNDKEHLKSVYTILSAIEGRLRRFSINNGRSLPLG